MAQAAVNCFGFGLCKIMEKKMETPRFRGEVQGLGPQKYVKEWPSWLLLGV